MNSPGFCTNCGFDLSLAQTAGAVISPCPGCGEELAPESVRHDTPTPLPPLSSRPAAPPLPPAPVPAAPTPPAAPVAPVLAVESVPHEAPLDSSIESNPFLTNPIATSPEAPAVSPQAKAASTPVAKTGAHAVGAPLQVQPGAVAPSLNDPHSEFRKGRWQRPTLFIVLAAAVLVGLVFLLPEAEQESTPELSTGKSERAVIGGSVSPLVIELPDEFAEKKAAPAPATTEDGAPSSTTSDSGAFSKQFKSQAD